MRISTDKPSSGGGDNGREAESPASRITSLTYDSASLEVQPGMRNIYTENPAVVGEGGEDVDPPADFETTVDAAKNRLVYLQGFNATEVWGMLSGADKTAILTATTNRVKEGVRVILTALADFRSLNSAKPSASSNGNSRITEA